MIETGVRFFLTAWSVIAMIIGAFGIILIAYQWLSADAFRRPITINGQKRAIDWRIRRYLLLGLAICACFSFAGAWLFSNAWVAGSLVGALALVPIWAYVVFFVLIWFGITGYLNSSAGWPSLQRCYDKPTGDVLIKQRLQWAVMGKGVTHKNVLSISAYRDGVGIEQSRLFGPFTRPIMVPWEEVSSSALEGGDTRCVRVRFGELENATLVLTEESWSKIEHFRDNA